MRRACTARLICPGLRRAPNSAIPLPYTRSMGLGRLLITLGLLLVGLGLIATFAARLPFRLGRLPGDISIHGKNGSFYFPLTTCLLLSLLLSAVLWVFRR